MILQLGFAEYLPIFSEGIGLLPVIKIEACQKDPFAMTIRI